MADRVPGAPELVAPLARKSYRQATVLLLGSAAWLLCCVMVYTTTGESGSRYEIHGLLMAAAVALCAVVGCATEAFGGFEDVWAISPCRSNLAWASVLALTLILFGVPLLFAVPDLQNLHALAVEGRRDLVQARVTGLRIFSYPQARGATYRLDLEFNLGGRVLRGRDWVPGRRFVRAGEEAEYILDQVGKSYRLFVTYLPSNPAIYSFNPVDRASVVRAGMSWGLAMLFLTAGLGLLCYYSRPLAGARRAAPPEWRSITH
jgi:hypothetical protein